MAMFERFTERARKVIIFAQEEAKRLNHSAVGTEHILLGIIREGEGVASKLLERLNINPEQIKSTIEGAIGHGDRTPYEEVAFTPRAKKVLEFGLDEARRLGHNYFGTEHLLLGLLREKEGVAAHLLGTMGVDLEKTRDEVCRILGEPTPAEYERGKEMKTRQAKLMHEVAAEVVKTIRGTMERKGIDEDELSRRLGQASGTVSYVLKGGSNVRVPELALFADALDCHFEWKFVDKES